MQQKRSDSAKLQIAFRGPVAVVVFLFGFSLPANPQSGVRVSSSSAPSAQKATLTTNTNVPAVSVPVGATISFCSALASTVPCTNKAITYSDATLTIACPANQQIVLDDTNTCVSNPDAQGNWGVWVAPGLYSYTVTLPDGDISGPRFIFAGGSSADGARAGSTRQLQINETESFGTGSALPELSIRSRTITDPTAVLQVGGSNPTSLGAGEASTQINSPSARGRTPSGANEQVQFNNSGEFGADPSFTFNLSGKNLSVQSFNNIVFLNSSAYPCSSAGITSAIAALPSSGGVVDGSGCSGSMTWGSNVLGSISVPVLLKLGAISITLASGQNIPSNMDIECIRTTNNNSGTQFTGTINAGAWFTFQDVTNAAINGCGFMKTGSAGGDLFHVIGSKFVHLTNLPNVNGNWTNLLLLDSDAGSSVLYNEFSDWFGVAGFTGNGVLLGSSNVGMTDNSNRFTNLVLPQGANSTCIMFDSGAVSTIGENRFFGGDCNAGSAAGSAGVNVNTSFARDNTFWGITIESEGGIGYNVIANAANTECIGCQISGNGTNVSDAGSNSIMIANVGGINPTRFWDQFGNLGANSLQVGNGASGCMNGVKRVSGCSAFGENPIAGAPTAGNDYIRADSTTHGLLASYSGSPEEVLPQVSGSVTVNHLAKWFSSHELADAVAADIVALFSNCSGIQYLGADGACHTADGADRDISGTISISGGTAGSFSFGTPYSSAPICTLTPTSDPAASVGTYWVTSTATTVTANVHGSGTITFNFRCVGNPN